jgi:hypothetical protein
MEPTINQGQLADLARYLQDYLLEEHVTQFETLQRQSVSLQIYCVLKGINLMVLGQHRASRKPDTAKVFFTLERAIRTLPPNLMAGVFDPKMLPCRSQVKLFLRALGQQQPYAQHQFTFVPVFIASLEDLESELADQDGLGRSLRKEMSPDQVLASGAMESAMIGNSLWGDRESLSPEAVAVAAPALRDAPLEDTFALEEPSEPTWPGSHGHSYHPYANTADANTAVDTAVGAPALRDEPILWDQPATDDEMEESTATDGALVPESRGMAPEALVAPQGPDGESRDAIVHNEGSAPTDLDPIDLDPAHAAATFSETDPAHATGPFSETDPVQGTDTISEAVDLFSPVVPPLETTAPDPDEPPLLRVPSSGTGDFGTANSRTANSRTANSGTGDFGTADAETANSGTIRATGALAVLSPPSQPTGFSYQAVDRETPFPWKGLVAMGGLVAVLSGLFVLSRPCMTDACAPLQRADRLSQAFVKSAQTAETEDDIRRAQTQLTEMTQQLQQIPRWSGRYGDAQTLMQRSQTQRADLDKLVLALDTLNQANRRAPETLPTPAQRDQQRDLFRAAIDQLTAIPNYSPLYGFAQTKLTEAQDTLALLNRQSLSKQEAQQRLAAAKSAAQTAQNRQAAAKSLEEWQLTKATWLTAVKALQTIPPDAENFAEAKPLLVTYQDRAKTAGDRLSQLQQAKQTYTDTLAIADRARTLEQQNQWTQAVGGWREALRRLRQIPAGSTYAEQAQPLVAAYEAALQQAEVQLKTVVSQQQTQQQITADLEKVCTGAEKICSFAIATDAIRLQLTPAYEQALDRAFNVGQTSNPGVYSKTVNHIDTLQTALQTICNNAGRPLEVYNATGTEMVGSFDPQG